MVKLLSCLSKSCIHPSGSESTETPSVASVFGCVTYLMICSSPDPPIIQNPSAYLSTCTINIYKYSSPAPCINHIETLILFTSIFIGQVSVLMDSNEAAIL